LSLNLKNAGLSQKILQKLAFEHDEVRWEELKASLCTNFTGNDSEFVVLDATSKNECTYERRYGRALSGKRAQLIEVFV
jgi:hypothetical protein